MFRLPNHRRNRTECCRARFCNGHIALQWKSFHWLHRARSDLLCKVDLIRSYGSFRGIHVGHANGAYFSTRFCIYRLCRCNEKSARRRRKHCALAVVRWSHKISRRRRPLPGGAGRLKFNQLEMVATFTYKPTLVRIDARNFELSW